jgi:microcystin-dependent protein
VTLLESEIPSHSHAMRAATDAANVQTPTSSVSLTRSSGGTAYSPTTTGLVAMSNQALAPAGGDQPHNNLQPYLTFYFAIALQGIFPPRGT